MGNDPLSPATRSAKRNLLLISLAIITVKAFNVTIEQIPLANLSIKFEPGALGFLLSAGLLYFLVAFTLYFYIDLKNFEVTKHQEDTVKYVRDAPSFYKSRLIYKVLARIKAILPDGYNMASQDDVRLFADNVRASQIFGVALEPIAYTFIRALTSGRNMTVSTIERSQDTELFNRVDDIINRGTRLYWWQFRLNELRHRWAGRRVRFTYLFRNYFVDGGLPVLVAITALLAITGIINLEWLREYSPVLKSPVIRSSG